jgi:hypothetical protein
MVAAIMLKFQRTSLPSNATLTFQFLMEMLIFWEELTSMQHATCFWMAAGQAFWPSKSIIC